MTNAPNIAPVGPGSLWDRSEPSVRLAVLDMIVDSLIRTGHLNAAARAAVDEIKEKALETSPELLAREFDGMLLAGYPWPDVIPGAQH